MTRKWINVAALMVIAFGASAAGMRTPTTSLMMDISKCEGGGRVCYCSHGCYADGSGCACG